MPPFVRAGRLFASGYLMSEKKYLGVYGLIPFDSTLIPSDTIFAPTFALT